MDVKKINTLYNCEGYPQLFESDSTKSKSTKFESTISEYESIEDPRFRSTKSESTKSESTNLYSTISEYESIEDPILNGSDLDLIEGDKLFSTPPPTKGYLIFFFPGCHMLPQSVSLTSSWSSEVSPEGS